MSSPTATAAIAPSAMAPSRSSSSFSAFKYTFIIILVLLALFFWYQWHGGRFPGMEMIDWVSPYEWAGLGVALALGLSVVGAGW